MRPRIVALAVALVACALARAAAAQEFAAPAPAGEPGIAAALEHGLVAADHAWGVTALAVRWNGLAELETRSVALAMGWRTARAAIGVSQTGERDIGWSALALAAGAAGGAGGFALRGVVRRRDAEIPERAWGGGVGAGAWVAASSNVTVWASAPQLWLRGDAPPLARWLEAGARLAVDGGAVWLARAVAPGAPQGLRAEHRGGIAAALGPAAVWLEGKDHPARGMFGLSAAWRGVQVSAAIEGHPVLGETTRVALAWGDRPWW